MLCLLLGQASIADDLLRADGESAALQQQAGLARPCRQAFQQELASQNPGLAIFQVSGRASVRLTTLLEKCAALTPPISSDPKPCEEGQQEELRRLREEVRHLEDPVTTQQCSKPGGFEGLD